MTTHKQQPINLLAVTSVAIDPLLANRRSSRAYDPQRDISDDGLLALLEAARWAPSCYGDQPWNYVVCKRSEDATAWNDALACLAPGNRGWAENAPVLMLAVALHDFRQRPEHNKWADYDSGGASMALCLQATSLGMIAHQMGGFDPDLAHKSFSLPDNCTAMAFIAVGYPLPVNKIPEQLVERESSSRNRLPLSYNFFKGRWGNGFMP